MTYSLFDRLCGSRCVSNQLGFNYTWLEVPPCGGSPAVTAGLVGAGGETEREECEQAPDKKEEAETQRPVNGNC